MSENYVQKWSHILLNWLNCLDIFKEDIKDFSELQDGFCLYSIMKHLSANSNEDWCGDNSKALSAVDVFLKGQFPSYTNPESLDLAVVMKCSLLLHSVCIDTHDNRLKSIMCKNLCNGDQAAIFIFTKSLMKHRPITYEEVQNAIFCATEAEDNQNTAVSSCAVLTPPAVRALQQREMDLRRLRTALDSERFDKCFLQDELKRIQALADKLAKENDVLKKEAARPQLVASVDWDNENIENTCPSNASDLKAAEKKIFLLKRDKDDMADKLQDQREQLENAEKKLTAALNAVTEGHRALEQLEARLLAAECDAQSERCASAALREMLSELRAATKNDCVNMSVEVDEADLTRQQPSQSGCNFSFMSACSTEDLASAVVEVQLRELQAKNTKLEDELIERASEITSLKTQVQSLNSLVAESDKAVKSLMDDMDKLKQTKHDLCHKLEQRDLTIISAENDIKILSDKLAERDAELNKQIISLKQTISEKKDKINHFKNENMNLKNATVTLKSNLGEKKKAITTMRNSKVESEKVIAKLECNLQNITEEKLRLYSENALLQNNLILKDEKIHDLQNKKKNIKNEVTSLNAKITILMTDHAEKIGDLHVSHKIELDSVDSRCQNEIDNLTQKMNEKVTELTIENELFKKNLGDQLVEKECEITRLTTHVHSLNNLVAESDSTIKSLKDDVDTLKQAKHDLSNKLEQKDLTILSYENDLKTLSDKLAKKDAELNGQIISLKQIVDEKKEKINHLENENSNFRNATETLESNLSEKENAIITMRNANAESERAIAEMKCKLQSLTEENLTMCSKYDELIFNLIKKDEIIHDIENDKKVREDELKSLNAKISSMMTDYGEKISQLHVSHNIELDFVDYRHQIEIDNLTQKLNEQIIELTKKSELLKSNLEDQLVEKECEITRLTTHVYSLNNLVAESDSTIKSLKDDVDTLKQAKHDLSNKLEQKDLTILSYENDLKSLSDKLAKKDAELNGQIISLKQIVDEKKEKINHLENENSNFRNATETLESNLSEKENAIITMRNANAESERAIAEMKCKLQSLTEENLTMCSKYDDLEINLIKKDEFIHDIQNDKKVIENELQSLITKNSLLISDYAEKISQLHTSHKIELDFVDYRHQIEIDNLTQKLNEQIIELTKKSELLKSNLDDQLVEKECEITRLTTHVHSLNNLVAESDSTIKSLKDDVDTLKQAKHDLSNKLERKDLTILSYENDLSDKLAKKDAELNGQIKSLKQIVDEKKEKINHLENENSNFRNATETLESNLSEKENAIITMRNANDLSERAIAEMECKLQSLIEENLAMCSKYDDLEINLIKKDEFIHDIQNDKKVIENELKSLITKNSLLISDYAEKISQLHKSHKIELDSVVSEYQNEIDNLTQKINKQLPELTKENELLKNKLEDQLTEKDCEVTRYESQIQSINSMVAESDKTIKLLMEDMDKFEQTKHDLCNKLEQRELAIIAAENDVKMLSDKLAENDSKLNRQIISLTQTVEETKEKINYLENENSNFRNATMSLETNLDEKEKSIKAMSNANVETEKVIAELERQIENITEEKLLLYSKYDLGQNTLNMKDGTIQNLQKEKQIIEDELISLNSMILLLKTNHIEKIGQLHSSHKMELDSIISEHRNEINNLTQKMNEQLTQFTKENELLKNAKEANALLLSEMENKLFKISQDNSHETYLQKVKVNNQLESLQEKLQEVTREKESIIDERNKLKEILDDKVERVTMENMKLCGQMTALNSELVIVRQEKAATVNSLEVIIYEKDKMISDMEKRSQTCKLRVSELEMIVKRLTEQIESNSSRHEALLRQKDLAIRKFQSQGSISVDQKVMEVREEYEDKLRRMKIKMEELYEQERSKYRQQYQEQLKRNAERASRAEIQWKELIKKEKAKYHEELSKQSERAERLEGRLASITAELWQTGEKMLNAKQDVDWLRKRGCHNDKFTVPMARPERASSAADLRMYAHSRQQRDIDTLSLHSAPPHRSDAHGIHMSDEEGEVFDNAHLAELHTTPVRQSRPPPGAPHNDWKRLSELQRRNSLCPPHLRSSYPAETQFHQPEKFKDDELKYLPNGAPSKSQVEKMPSQHTTLTADSYRRKDPANGPVYKRPGPPTPSKKGGRLSATGSELRNTMQDSDMTNSIVGKKSSTPSRLRALFMGASTLSEGERWSGYTKTLKASSHLMPNPRDAVVILAMGVSLAIFADPFLAIKSSELHCRNTFLKQIKSIFNLKHAK